MAETRIHLCGSLVARVDGERVEERLRGRQGRLLFAYLVEQRRRPVPRAELAAAVWPDEPPAAADAALSALLSRLRRAVPLEGRGEVRLALAGDAWVDVEALAESLHRAAAAVARDDWRAAWGPARVAQHIAMRGYLAGETAPWVEARRREVEEHELRALELAGAAAIGIGGGELATAERAARRLVARAPLRESGHRLLMETLDRRGNRAEALAVFDALRVRLREELGAAPAPATRELHRRLLA